MDKLPKWLRWVIFTVFALLLVVPWVLLVLYMRKAKRVIILRPKIKIVKVIGHPLKRPDGSVITNLELENTISAGKAILMKMRLIK